MLSLNSFQMLVVSFLMLGGGVLAVEQEVSKARLLEMLYPYYTIVRLSFFSRSVEFVVVQLTNHSWEDRNPGRTRITTSRTPMSLPLV